MFYYQSVSVILTKVLLLGLVLGVAGVSTAESGVSADDQFCQLLDTVDPVTARLLSTEPLVVTDSGWQGTVSITNHLPVDLPGVHVYLVTYPVTENALPVSITPIVTETLVPVDTQTQLTATWQPPAHIINGEYELVLYASQLEPHSAVGKIVIEDLRDSGFPVVPLTVDREMIAQIVPNAQVIEIAGLSRTTASPVLVAAEPFSLRAPEWNITVDVTNQSAAPVDETVFIEIIPGVQYGLGASLAKATSSIRLVPGASTERQLDVIIPRGINIVSAVVGTLDDSGAVGRILDVVTVSAEEAYHRSLVDYPIAPTFFGLVDGQSVTCWQMEPQVVLDSLHAHHPDLTLSLEVLTDSGVHRDTVTRDIDSTQTGSGPQQFLLRSPQVVVPGQVQTAFSYRVEAEEAFAPTLSYVLGTQKSFTCTDYSSLCRRTFSVLPDHIDTPLNQALVWLSLLGMVLSVLYLFIRHRNARPTDVPVNQSN